MWQRLYNFSRYIFSAKRNVDMLDNWHQRLICEHLEQVFRGHTKRLIINVPPRSGKTELAVKAFIAWSMGLVPDSEFIHASYSKRLATANTYDVRAMMQHEAYRLVFPWLKLQDDSKAKDEFRTTAGGIVYATGADGTITGYGASKMRDSFGGCFPAWQEIETEHGPRPIGELVSACGDLSVWSYNEAQQKRVLHRVTRFWRNPANDIIRVVMSDGSHFDCTPDHEILTASGWIAAIHLANALDLINAESSQSTSLSTGNAPVINNFNDAFRMLWSHIPTSIRQVIRYDFPSFTHLNLADDPNSDAIILSQNGGAIAALEYFNNLFSAQLGSGPSFKDRECPVSQSILHIVGLCAIREIAKPVVSGNSIEVSNLIPIGAFTYKLLCDQMSNVFGRNIPIDGKIDTHISLAIGRRLKKSDGLCPSDLSKVRNLVKPRCPSNIFPIGVFYVGHIDETFCLEVGGVHNFELSHTGAIVSNCIIIDDPHKAGEATSPVMRQSVIDWYQSTIQSRLNKPDGPIIIIMQRLHEEDLSGWLLNGGSGEPWAHLVIPARDDQGQSFWPEQFPDEMLDRLELTSPYVFAGQYMQRPAPLGGGIFKDEWWRFFDAMPPIKYRTIYADTAQKTKEQNDYSVFQCWGVTQDNQAVMLDMARGKWEAPELETMARAFWQKHHAQAGHGPLRAIKVEDKVSGTGLIQKLKREGMPIIPIQRNTDKITRAFDAAPYVQSGNVYLMRGLPHLADFLSEAGTFPNATHDDMIDAAMSAISDLTGPQAAPAIRAL